MTPGQIRANQALCKHRFATTNDTPRSRLKWLTCLNGCGITLGECGTNEELRKGGLV